MSRITELTNYIVMQYLLDPKIVDVIYDYFVNNMSPSTICEKYRIPKYIIRRHIQNVYSKTRLGPVATSKMVKLVVDVVRAINIAPIYYQNNGHRTCRLCNNAVANNPSLRIHILKEHKEFVDALVDEVLEKIVRTVKAVAIQGYRH